MNNYFDSEEFQDILARYEESQKAGGSCYFDSDEFVDISDYYMETNRATLSLKVVEQGLRQHPDNATLKCAQCGLLIYFHRFDDAKKIWNELGKESKLEKTYLEAQLTYAYHHNVKKADQIFHEWFKMLQKDWERQKEREDYDSEEADNAIRDAYLHVMMSYIELSLIEHDEQLKGWIEEYVERYHPLGRNENDRMVADIVRECEYVDLIIKVFTSFLDNDPYFLDGWMILASAQHHNGDIDDALNSLEFALAIDPNNGDALSIKAHCLYDKSLFADALPCFLTARKYDEEHLDDRFISYCYLMLDDMDNALIYLKSAAKALVNCSGYAPEAQGWAMLEVAEQYLNIQHPKEALALVNKAQKLLPHQQEVMMLKGSIFLAMNQTEKALKVFSKVVKNVIHLPSALVQIGGTFLTYNYCNYSIPIFEKALIFPESSEFANRNDAYLYLAMAHYKLNNLDKSAEYLQIACEKCPERVKQIFPNIPATLPPEDYFDYIVKTNYSK